jgi:hypothetical protein
MFALKWAEAQLLRIALGFWSLASLRHTISSHWKLVL